MELKSYQIISMSRAMEKIKSADVSLKTAIAIAKNIKALSDPIEIIQGRQKALLDEYARKDDDGEVIQESNGNVYIENPNEYFPKLQDLLNTELEFELIKIKMDDLGEVKLSADDILALDPLFEDEDDNKEEKKELPEVEVE